MTKELKEEEEEEEEEEIRKRGRREMKIGKSSEQGIAEIVIGSIALMRIYPSARMPPWAMSSLHVFVPLPSPFLFSFSLINPAILPPPKMSLAVLS